MRSDTQGFRVVLAKSLSKKNVSPRREESRDRARREESETRGSSSTPSKAKAKAKDQAKYIEPYSMRINSLGMRMVYLPPGSFLMEASAPKKKMNKVKKESSVIKNLGKRGRPGEILPMPEVRSKKGLNEVSVSEGFWIASCEVTQKQWTKVMDYNPSHFNGDDRPVENVSWDQAKQFCKRLSMIEERTYRLPKQIEWEYACRAGGASKRYGDAEDISWNKMNSGMRTHDVGLKDANDWGIFDTLGNVSEWCLDAPGILPGYIRMDSLITDIAPKRIVRGGHYRSSLAQIRASNRKELSQKAVYNTIGFRVLCEL